LFSFNKYQFTRLKQAAAQLDPKQAQTILRLRALLRSPKNGGGEEFQKLFTGFYGLNSGGLTEDFKKRYFELLFAFNPRKTEPYGPLLRDLYPYERRQGDRALQFSFVSKLVVTYDESLPVYDRHVRKFFSISEPKPGPVELRISSFVVGMNVLHATYLAWVADPRFEDILKLAVKKSPDASKIHPVRLCDLLVWTIGDQEIQ
jgi:hypothetical protein